MKLNRRALAAVAATGVASGALGFAGVALASTSSAQSPAVTTAAAAATPAATATPQPASGQCEGGPGGPGGPGFGYGRQAGPQVMKAAAAYLGISQDTLLSQLRSGKSLADVATARGKSVSGLKNAILAAGTSQIDASTALSAAQKTALISELKSHLDAIVNLTYPAGPGRPGTGWPGHGVSWMPGGVPGM